MNEKRNGRIAVSPEQMMEILRIKQEQDNLRQNVYNRFVELVKTTRNPFCYLTINVPEGKILEEILDIHPIIRDNRINPNNPVETMRKSERFSNETIVAFPKEFVKPAFYETLKKAHKKHISKLAKEKTAIKSIEYFGAGGKTQFITDKVMLNNLQPINYSWAYFTDTENPEKSGFILVFHENLFAEYESEQKNLKQRRDRINASKRFDNGTDNPNIFNPFVRVSDSSANSSKSDVPSNKEQIEEISKEATSEVSFGFNGG